MTDPFSEIAALADAVLYEGYLLYPYRASAQKNRVRWQWGVLMPSGHGADSGEVSSQRAEVLVEPRGDDATLRVRVRFLRQERRALFDADGRPVESLTVGDVRHLAFDEGVPSQVDAVPTIDSIRDGTTIPIRLPASRTEERLSHPDGSFAGRIVRTRSALTASAGLTAREIPGPYATLRLTLEIHNASAVTPGDTRDEALRTAMIGTHTLMAVTPGSFVSPTDPPEWARELVAGCASENVWPSLAGPEDRSDLLLCTPIILGDHARIAPESGIDLFDGTENDEILTLRTMVLTEAEKAEARATDPRAAEIIDAVDALPPEMLDRLHGAIRSLRGPTGRADDGVPTFTTPGNPPAELDEGAVRAMTRDERGVRSPVAPLGADSPEAAPPESTPWWDPGADSDVDPETDSVLVGDRSVARGSAVVLRPGRGTDAQDRFLTGMRATVQAVVHDVDGGVHVAVSVDDDPAAEMQLAHGRFRYFRPDELEPA
ncbi:hypothetical protein [Pseudonocardia endophytica]|uniref:Uncharacterized protein n=1 Tax=Pseudonocardia endophytica TaxID=401976 RepID=A0A4R1HKB5_PSEEN|nr:hypothetical protein [Pseudonocardia endophytica]TCK22328.1 hypothetical protein EV378_6329 [Pseudonocardia endophytica]